MIMSGRVFYAVSAQCSKFDRTGLALVTGHCAYGMDQPWPATSLPQLGIKRAVSDRLFDISDHGFVSHEAADRTQATDQFTGV